MDAQEGEHSRQREYFETRDHGYMTPIDSTYVRRQVDQLVRFGNLTPDARILEIGCGMGRYTLPLAQAGFKVEGLDISPAMLDGLHLHNPGPPIKTYCAGIESHPTELDGAFDAVVGFFVLHHLDDLTEQFRFIRHMLKPSGRAVFMEPNPFNPLYYFQITLSRNMAWWAEKGMFGMRRRRLFEILNRAGYAGSGWSTFGFFPPFVINQGWAPGVEDVLQRIGPLKPLLPFLLIRAANRPEP